MELIRTLIWRDFKSAYAGTGLGIIWALVHPAFTVAVYALVFSVGFKSAPVLNVPYVLWLIAAIAPWLFFQAGFAGCTSVLYEYVYLVKKTPFNTLLLPIIKVCGGLIAHLMFALLAILIFAIWHGLSLYILQLPYYMLCLFLFTLFLGYLNAALSAFFKDVAQITALVLQLLFWLTPIAWDINIMPKNLGSILRLNPLYYIIQGYRDSLIGGVWIIERPLWTAYFWIIVLALFALSLFLYNKLKRNFADVI